ncbi:LPXTG cell wall anchor domain-containing protein [Neobacillus mesonae]|nr:LPXTG cell wall anchor domain-containing protein [Neobacillus mesonae]
MRKAVINMMYSVLIIIALLGLFITDMSPSNIMLSIAAIIICAGGLYLVNRKKK